MEDIYNFVGMLFRAHISFTLFHDESLEDAYVEIKTDNQDTIIFHFNINTGNLEFVE